MPPHDPTADPDLPNQDADAGTVANYLLGMVETEGDIPAVSTSKMVEVFAQHTGVLAPAEDQDVRRRRTARGSHNPLACLGDG